MMEYEVCWTMSINSSNMCTVVSMMLVNIILWILDITIDHHDMYKLEYNITLDHTYL